MLTSLFTAVSGMNANGTALSVIGDNIANMNTAAFKGSSVSFGDVLSQSIGDAQIGRGVLVEEVKPGFTQGAFESSTNVLDMAVDGDGFFIVKNQGDTFYSRAGQFSVDKTGYVVNSNGKRLQGYQYTPAGVGTSVLGDINVSSLNSQPSATTNVDISVNLDSSSDIKAAFDVSNPDTTSNYSTSITVYDSLGNSHLINVYFRKATEAATGNTWEWYGVTDAADSTSGSTEIQANGTLTYTNGGALDVESAINYPTGGFDFSGGAAQDQAIALNFGTSITTDGGSGLDGSTQFGAASTTNFQDQNGYTSGALKNITMSQDGVMTGVFTNGQTRNISRVALAKFIAPSELTKMGRNLYAESYNSGQPIISEPGDTGTGYVLANTLELSNVDLASEFVKMITSQRAFQANSRIVSTTDELMQELVNLKR
jgi:flagellar hook protein FlgE